MRIVLPSTSGPDTVVTIYRDGVPVTTLLLHGVNPATLIEAELPDEQIKTAKEMRDRMFATMNPK